MSEFNTETLVTMLALVGIVVILATLLSGAIESSGLPQVAVFLIIGAVFGPVGLDVLHIAIDSPILRIVATLSLVLVLFTDAISLNLTEVRRESTLVLLVLGPATLLSAFLMAVFGRWLLGLTSAAAVLLGAALASTDPVTLRGLLRRNDVPARARQALRLESGLNDVVLLPIVLVAMAFLSKSSENNITTWARLALDLLVLGPGAGVLVGVCGVATMAVIRKQIGIRRDYESLFSLGIAFTAYAAAEAVHGSGFLATFAAGLMISAMDVEMCDCFLEYGETTAELTLLFTFVLFGTSLIWSGLGILSFPLLLFAVITLLIRPIAFLLSLIGIRLAWKERLLISWFGPRGLSSLLLILLPVFSGIAGSEQLFAICSLVVLVSIVAHGGTLFSLNRRLSRTQEMPVVSSETQEAALADSEVEASPSTLTLTSGIDAKDASVENSSIKTYSATVDAGSKERAKDYVYVQNVRITTEEVRQLQKQRANLILLDVRTQRSYESSDQRVQGAIRLDPQQAAFLASRLGLPRDAWLIGFCT